MEPELRSEKGAEGLAGSARLWNTTRGVVRKVRIRLRRWREGKVRPIRGNSPPAPPVSWGVCSLRRVCDDPFSATPLLQLPTTSEDPRNAFGEACGIYRSDGDQTNSPKGPPYRLPLVGPEVAVAAPRIHYEVLSPTPFLCRAVQKCEGPRNAFVQAWRNLSVRCVITSDKPGAGVPLHGRVRARL